MSRDRSYVGNICSAQFCYEPKTALKNSLLGKTENSYLTL